jgi:hypothetical protein
MGLHQSGAKLVACSASDGQYLAMGTHGDSDDAAPGEIRLWDTEARQVGAVFRGIISRVRSRAFAPDGRTLAAASREGVFVWYVPIPSPKRPTNSADSKGPPSRAHDSDQEFILLKVRYLGLWPVARPATSPKVGASIALWDDWVDRQT